VQFGLLPEAQWLMAYNDLRRTDDVHFSYPAYQFILDAPLVMWSDAKTTEVEKQAAAALGQYLMSNAGQQTVLQYGWRPANSEPSDNTVLFTNAAQAGISPQAIPGTVVLTPARSDAEYLARELQ
jgi:ABC-type sulfate transport system substrate-binding protein